MKVVVFEPLKPGRIEEIENDLRIFQNIVGGYIETVTYPSGHVMVCNEEGKLLNLPQNMRMIMPNGNWDLIFGTFFFAKDDGEGNLTDIDEETAAALLKWGPKL